MIVWINKRWSLQYWKNLKNFFRRLKKPNFLAALLKIPKRYQMFLNLPRKQTSVLEPVTCIKMKSCCACRRCISRCTISHRMQLQVFCLCLILFMCKLWEILHGWESQQIYLLHFQLMKTFQEKTLIHLNQLKIFKNLILKPFLNSSEHVLNISGNWNHTA